MVTGIGLGLGLIVKSYALVLVPIPVMVAFHLGRESPREAIQAIVIVAVLVLSISGWWFVRNTRLYGDPLAVEAQLNHIGIILPDSLVQRSVTDLVFRGVFLQHVRESFWHRGGWGQIRPPQALYLGLDLLTLIAGTGLVVGIARRRLYSVDPDRRRLGAVLGVCVLLQFAGIVLYNLRIQQFQGRWLFPVMPAIAFFLVSGIASLVPGRWSKAVAVLTPTLLLGLSIFVLLGVAAPAYNI